GRRQNACRKFSGKPARVMEDGMPGALGIIKTTLSLSGFELFPVFGLQMSAAQMLQLLCYSKFSILSTMTAMVSGLMLPMIVSNEKCAVKPDCCPQTIAPTL